MNILKTFFLTLLTLVHVNLFCSKGFIIINENPTLFPDTSEIQVEVFQFSEDSKNQAIPLELVLDNKEFKKPHSTIKLYGKDYILINNSKKTITDLMKECREK